MNCWKAAFLQQQGDARLKKKKERDVAVVLLQGTFGSCFRTMLNNISFSISLELFQY